MRRLSTAQDRELRHARNGRVAWRRSRDDSGLYAWCRICDRDATKQIDWLIGRGYVAGALTTSTPFNVVTVPGMVDPYLERYPR